MGVALGHSSFDAEAPGGAELERHAAPAQARDDVASRATGVSSTAGRRAVGVVNTAPESRSDWPSCETGRRTRSHGSGRLLGVSLLRAARTLAPCANAVP